MKGFGPDELLNCYRLGVFPMAESASSKEFFLLDPEERAILPLDDFHVPRRLARTVRQNKFRVTADRAFVNVIETCAEATPDRDATWINPPIIDLYCDLHHKGRAHSVECWDGDTLVGGLYGVSLGGAFFGESMFSRSTDASKVALVHLVARLRSGGFTLLDAQFDNDHLHQFGLIVCERAAFQARLSDALERQASFYPRGFDALEDPAGALVMHLITQTS